MGAILSLCVVGSHLARDQRMLGEILRLAVICPSCSIVNCFCSTTCDNLVFPVIDIFQCRSVLYVKLAGGAAKLSP